MIKTERKCTICKTVKDLTSENFHSDKSRPGGFMYGCRVCEKIRSKAKYDKNPRTGRYAAYTTEQKAKHAEIGAAYRATPMGRAIGLASAYKKYDKDRGHQTDITKHDILEVRKHACAYCGFPSTGFDRLNNSLGHIRSNCVPCCIECNVARMDNFTHEEMKIIGLSIKQVKESRLS